MIQTLRPSSKIIFITLSFFLFCFITTNSQPIIINPTSNLQKNQTDQKNHNHQFPTFDEFIETYKKGYEKDSLQYKKRKEIYERRIEKLIQMQKDPEIDYEVGVNHFSDLSDQERASRKPLQIDDNSRKQYMAEPKKIANSFLGAGAPTSLDWRQSGVVTSIKDQGECGSCWTFATCGYGQSRLVQKKLASINVDLSQQYLLSCTPQCTCQGGYLEYVFEKAAGGVPPESDYSYSPYMPTNPFICWAKNKIYFGYIPQKYYDVDDSEMITLLQQGPVAISVSATGWQDYKGGVFRCKTYDKVNHAVLLIGYTPDYWIIKNQWGTDWGQSGYIRVTRNQLYNCKIGASAFVMWEIIHSLALSLVLFLLLSY